VTAAPRITAVGVIVPARNEQDRIEACLRSIRRALAALPAGTATAVAVVLDRCVDRTPELVAAFVEGWPGATAVRVAAVGGHRAGTAIGPGPAHIVAGSGVGAVRDLGVRRTLHALRRHPRTSTWLLNTDADTTVPPTWALDHLHYAERGIRGVAGTAELHTLRELSTDARRRYRKLIRDGLPVITGEPHGHVYGANLGVRADAYLAVDGFPAHGSGEDHGLWRRLQAAGYPLAQPVEVSVTTSARLRGRAAGGLADLLRSLHAGCESAGEVEEAVSSDGA
jgi:hypothetical protein